MSCMKLVRQGRDGRELSFYPPKSQKAQLLACLVVAKVAETDAVLSGFRHEPGCFPDWLLILAPGAFDRAFGFRIYVHM